ncbi:MAG TPA: hypothetical protein VKV73_26080 [Chloroflexota bacterium]|nr:hypothetical protein [Chloroflexota bacterium]
MKAVVFVLVVIIASVLPSRPVGAAIPPCNAGNIAEDVRLTLQTMDREA